MQTAETLLAIYGERGRHGKPLEGVYRNSSTRNVYLRAYYRLAKNEGAMTRGATEETVDAMSMERIQGIIELLRHERYRWTAVRRVLILSGDTNSDPLPPVLIPTPIMPSCYRLLTSPSGSFLIFTSVSRWVCSGLTFVNLDRINPLLRFSRSR